MGDDNMDNIEDTSVLFVSGQKKKKAEEEQQKKLHRNKLKEKQDKPKTEGKKQRLLQG